MPAAVANPLSVGPVSSGGGSASITVQTGPACAWTAAVNSVNPWITITAGGSGTGAGTVCIGVQPNTTTSQRTEP